jgi:hypothetical protein
MLVGWAVCRSFRWWSTRSRQFRSLRLAVLRTGAGSLRRCRLVPTVFYLEHCFLATVESPLHPNFKQAIVDSDGHDTQLSEPAGFVGRAL